MRGHPPKEIRERREGPHHQKKIEDAPKKSRWLDPLNLTIGIAGFVLAVIGLALALKAGPTVSLQSPLDPQDVLTTPIEITNAGMLDLENVRFRSFEIDVSDIHGRHRTNNLSMNSKASPSTIGTGQAQTIPFLRTLGGQTVPLAYADVVVLVLFNHNTCLSGLSVRLLG